VDGVSLAIAAGRTLALVGESGCGKTTVGKGILQLVRPTGGEVSFDGVALTRLRGNALRRRRADLQIVFQDPYASLNPRKHVAAIIGLPLAVHGIGTPDERARRVEEMMERVGLARRLAQNYPNQLSGGQRQRVAIARALVTRPEVVVCDEPTSALDVSVQSQILNLLAELRRDLGLTYVFISHNLAVVEHIATRVAVMYLGRIVEEADTARLFSDPRHPYTRALLDSVLTPEPGRGVPDTQLGAAYPNPLEPPAGCAFHPRCPAIMARCRTDPPASTGDAASRVECHLYV
jgi:peptide/nickel transport system ATP-binding protein